jgi:hypothetical protein
MKTNRMIRVNFRTSYLDGVFSKDSTSTSVRPAFREFHKRVYGDI